MNRFHHHPRTHQDRISDGGPDVKALGLGSSLMRGVSAPAARVNLSPCSAGGGLALGRARSSRLPPGCGFLGLAGGTRGKNEFRCAVGALRGHPVSQGTCRPACGKMSERPFHGQQHRRWTAHLPWNDQEPRPERDETNRPSIGQPSTDMTGSRNLSRRGQPQ